MKLRNWKHYLMAGAFALTAHSGSADALLAGVKATGMAAACTSYPIDCFAGAYNPAGMTLLCDRFDLGANTVHFRQSTTIVNYTPTPDPFGFGPQDGRRNGARTSENYGGEFGINKKFCFNACNQNIELALSLIGYNRNFIKTTYSQPYTIFGTSSPGLEYIHETIAPILSARFFERHSIGIAFNYHIQRLKVNGLENFKTLFAARSVDATHTTNRGYNYSQGFGVTIGYLCEVTDCLRVGGSWQPKQKMSRFKKYDGFVADHGRFDIPDRWQVGVSYSVLPSLTIAGDYEYINWKTIPQLGNKPFPNFFLSLLGSPDGAGFGWDNQHYWRVGVNYDVNSAFTVRAGFRHTNAPIRSSYTAINLLTLDCVEDVLTCGATWRMDRCNEFSFFYAYGFNNKINGSGSVPATPPFFGQADSEVNLQQSLMAFGLSWGMHF